MDLPAGGSRRLRTLGFALWVPPVALAAAAGGCAAEAPLPPAPDTVPERSDYSATSSHAEVMDFLCAVEAAGDRRVWCTTFGVTPQGRALPLVVVADPPVRSPAQALASGRPRVLVLGDIHAGEVDGKEACLEILRDVVWAESGRPPYPVSDLVLLLAPIYNADGNDRFGPNNRPLQNGPGFVGEGDTAGGLNLNRDFTKLECQESRALVRLLCQWDPHLLVDLHTTDGSAHGYELTYAGPLSPAAHPALRAMAAEEWLPELRRRMRERHGFETFDYGNFLTEGGGSWFQDAPDAVRGWRTFDHRPRFSTNYAGLRNRLALLSESYAYEDFRTRIRATKAFVLEILGLAAERGPELLDLCRRLDAETAALGARGQLVQATAVELVARGGAEPLLLRGVDLRRDPVTGADVRVASGPRTVVEVPCFVRFAPARARVAPRAYLVAPEAAAALATLRLHGLHVERLCAPVTREVEVHRVRAARRAGRPFQGHHERSADWDVSVERRTLPAGAWRVPLDQPLARLAFQLLDPQADDGLLNWNFFDPWLDAGPGAELPVYGER